MTPLKLRREAAARYRPEHVKLLLVAEAPPLDGSRYFYFQDVETHDELFRATFRCLTGGEPCRRDKASQLEQLRDCGVFLVDLFEEKVDFANVEHHVRSLVSRCSTIAPDNVILIKASVYDVAYRALKAASIPVAPQRVYFPGSGRQPEFREQFSAALKSIGWTSYCSEET